MESYSGQSIEGTEKYSNGDRFKIAFITACYVMFVEERGGEVSPKVWIGLRDEIPFEDKNKTKQRIKIKSLFYHYAIRWKVLLCSGYYQTDNPYDALYHSLMEQLIKTGNTKELIYLRDTVFPDKQSFHALYTYVLTDMSPCLDMQTFVNIIMTTLEVLK